MFLGIDIGTSAVKAIIVDSEQHLVADATSGYTPLRPAPGLSEQDPETWVEAVRTALGALRRQAPAALAAAEAIGLSGQMHSVVALDETHRPLRPSILWNDGRGKAECADLLARLPDLPSITGVMPMPGFTAAKLLWIKAHEPETFARIATVMLAKDYVRLWLSGEIATDVSDAAGTQLLDEASRRWAAGVVDAVGLRLDQLPRLVEGTDISGRLRPDVAAEFGMKPGIPVAGGGGDAGTGSVGIGCVDNNDGFFSLGTAAVFVITQDTYRPKPDLYLHTFAHSVPGRWYQMAGMLNGASALAFAMEMIGETDYAAMFAAVERDYRGPSRVLFLPYLTGERTPHNNPDARGVFFGLDPTVTKVDIVQAVMEGIAFSLKDAQDALEAAGCNCPEPGFIGGGARSAFWGRIIATVLGRPIVKYESGQLGPALGAARLAIVAATGDPIRSVCFRPREQQRTLPDEAFVGAYAERHEKYRALYRSLRGLF